MRALTIACLVTACSSSSSSSSTPSDKLTLTEVKLDFRSSRRGELGFELLEDGKPIARRVSLRVDVRHANGHCTLFGEATEEMYVPPKLRAHVPVIVRSRGAGGGCGFGELVRPAVVVIVTPTVNSDHELATASMSPSQLSIPDLRPKPLPALDAELAKLGNAISGLETVEVPKCTGDLVADVDPGHPLEGVELETLRAIAAPDGKPPPWSRMRSQLYVKLANYRRRTPESKAEPLVAQVRDQRYALVYAIKEDRRAELEGHDEFTPAYFSAIAYFVDLRAGKARCSFPIVAGSSELVRKKRDTFDVLQLDSDLRHRIVEVLRDQLATISRKLVPPDAPKLEDTDPGAGPSTVGSDVEPAP
jgi:hypothetical protein